MNQSFLQCIRIFIAPIINKNKVMFIILYLCGRNVTSGAVDV